ncbi:MAG TPA: right-handed parallel beta-helix repeat-containing protein [Candidatus Binatia bacterium]|nr:right-handed parallel beta-helix repeat-containing protein [Candidatus Binatia bacterium]
MSRFVVAFGVLAAVVQAGAVTVPLGTASGGLAIHYNLTGPESPTNQAWVKAQFGPAVSNGALFDFDATVLPGTGGQSWSSIFQSVPHQFGFDVVLTAPTTDGSNPTPVLSAFDNVDGNLAHATNAGPVTWAIDDYQGSPGAPGAGVINSLFRGGTGANDGVTITTQTVTQNGTVFTLHIAGELQSDGLVHWYNPAFGSSPVGSLELTGKLLFDGTLTYDSAGDTGTDRVDFYAGTVTLAAEVVCGDRFVDAVAGSDSLPGPAFNDCRNAAAPCKTIQRTIDISCPGETIHVANGTYVENVVVTKPLTLDGAGPGAIVQPAVSDPNCGGAGGGSICPGASNAILVQASDVDVHGLTVDGDNPALTSGVVAGGADLDARNGIITDHTLGTPFDNLVVHDVTVKNVYLRGIYASSGGTFDFHDNAVDNVQADPASIGIFAFTGSGTMARNHVSRANDAISANHSAGIQFLDNVVTASLSGVHTDNAGDGGGTADVISGNTVSACGPNGFGVWVFVPYLAPTVTNNTVTGCTVGLAAFGQGAAVTTAFTGNTIDGGGAPGTIGAAVTTDIAPFGSRNVAASLDGNVLRGNAVGVQVEQQPGFVTTATLTCNRIVDNVAGIVSQTAGASAHRNAVSGGATGADGTAIASGTMSADDNWWGCAGGPGSVGCGAVLGAVDFLPLATTPDACVPQTAALNPTRVTIRRSTNASKPNGSILARGDFLVDQAGGDVLTAAGGVDARVLDATTLDTKALGLPDPLWVAATCRTEVASGVPRLIRCTSPDRRLHADFRAIPPIHPGATQGYRFKLRLRRLDPGGPFFAGPITVSVRVGATDRVGVIGHCGAKRSGLSCD